MEEGEESRDCWVVWEERKVGRLPRNAVSQRDRFGETSKSLDAREAIWSRRDWALGSGGRRESNADEVVVVVVVAAAAAVAAEAEAEAEEEEGRMVEG